MADRKVEEGGDASFKIRTCIYRVLAILSHHGLVPWKVY